MSEIYLSQPELVRTILKAIAEQVADEQGCEPDAVNIAMADRHFNAVIRAADLIVEEFGRGFRKSEPGSGLRDWFASDDTGLSSKALAARLSEAAGSPVRSIPERERRRHPYDQGDFGRCVRMLEACPDLREHLPVARDISPEWSNLIDHWAELESLYREEWPTGSAPRLYERIESLLKGGG